MNPLYYSIKNEGLEKYAFKVKVFDSSYGIDNCQTGYTNYSLHTGHFCNSLGNNNCRSFFACGITSFTVL